jgi:hypothetical protein
MYIYYSLATILRNINFKNMNRRQNFQTIAWFNDLYKRGLLNLDPPYQRRSVWTQSFKDYFIDTILLEYPAPTIFLFEEITDDGITKYNVVDGKQRLTTIFAFISNIFPVSDSAIITEYREKFFSDLSTDAKTKFWSYSFSVEYLPTKDETIINNIFDRINKNVAKLTPQELRHAKYSGVFITICEELTEWMFDELPDYFPQIAKKSMSQMKDVEFISQILLKIESEPKGYNTDELDEEFNKRDDEWDLKNTVIHRFKNSISTIKDILTLDNEDTIARSRFKNQADFYTLVSAIDSLTQERALPDNTLIMKRLIAFINHELTDASEKDIKDYYEFVKAASNRTLARTERERILKRIISGVIAL